MASKQLTWLPSGEGYLRSDGLARLINMGNQRWFLVVQPSGQTFDLPPNPKFSHADAIMSDLAQRQSN